MQDFDSELERMIRNGTLAMDVALGYATNPGNLRLQVADFKEGDIPTESAKATETVSSYTSK